MIQYIKSTGVAVHEGSAWGDNISNGSVPAGVMQVSRDGGMGGEGMKYIQTETRIKKIKDLKVQQSELKYSRNTFFTQCS